jgi:hypothetical protein
MDIKILKTMPDKKLEELLEKYVEKNTRYKFFVNEETDRSENILIEINNELKDREIFRNSLKGKKPRIDIDESDN